MKTSLKNTSSFINTVYSYLGYKNIEHDEAIDKLIKECIEEVEELSQFKYIYSRFDYRLDFLNNNNAYKKLLKDSNSYFLVLTTLGKRIDDKCKYYSFIDMTKSLVFDAVSSAYLEYKADEFEENEFKMVHSYRFCPGYQGTKTDDIREIFKYLDHKKIGVSILDSNLMIPLKTMCGIIAIGVEAKKECGDCYLKEKCEFKKGGKVCFKN